MRSFLAKVLKRAAQLNLQSEASSESDARLQQALHDKAELQVSLNLLQDQIAMLRDELTHQEELLQTNRTIGRLEAVEESEAKLTSLTRQIEALKSEVEASKEVEANQQSMIKDLQAKLQTAQETKTSLAAEERLVLENAILQAEVKLQAQLDSFEKLQTTCQENSEEVVRLTEELASGRVEHEVLYSQFQSSLEEQNVLIKDLQEQLEEQESKRNELSTEVNRLETALQQLQREKSEEATAMKEKIEETEEEREEWQVLQQQVQWIQSQVDVQRMRSEELLQEQQHQYQQELREVEERYQNELQSLQAALKEQENGLQNTKELLHLRQVEVEQSKEEVTKMHQKIDHERSRFIRDLVLWRSTCEEKDQQLTILLEQVQVLQEKVEEYRLISALMPASSSALTTATPPAPALALMQQGDDSNTEPSKDMQVVIEDADRNFELLQLKESVAKLEDVVSSYDVQCSRLHSIVLLHRFPVLSEVELEEAKQQETASSAQKVYLLEKLVQYVDEQWTSFVDNVATLEQLLVEAKQKVEEKETKAQTVVEPVESEHLLQHWEDEKQSLVEDHQQVLLQLKGVYNSFLAFT